LADLLRRDFQKQLLWKELFPSTEREAMSENEWVAKAAAHVLQYIPNYHPSDASALAEDLQRSWPGLQPSDAVRFFFRPLQPQSGTLELT
jgi:hypothetical protein